MTLCMCMPLRSLLTRVTPLSFVCRMKRKILCVLENNLPTFQLDRLYSHPHAGWKYIDARFDLVSLSPCIRMTIYIELVKMLIGKLFSNQLYTENLRLPFQITFDCLWYHACTYIYMHACMDLAETAGHVCAHDIMHSMTLWYYTYYVYYIALYTRP